MDQTIDQITVNGKTYYAHPASDPAPNGKRAVIVVDRGWIFAGDVTEEDGRIKLSRAVWVFNWNGIGFDGVIANPKSDKAQIRKLSHTVDIPADSEIFRVPVADSWGI